MQIVHLPAPLALSPEIQFAPGDYLSPDQVAMQLLLHLGDGEMQKLTATKPLDASADYNGKRIMIQRAGGFGDIVLMTPIFREIKRRWPTCHLGVSCMRHYAVVLDGLPYIDEIVQFPTPMNVAASYDVWIFYENAIEKNPRAREVHMTDLFAEIAGLGNIEDSHAAYKVKPSEMIWANEMYPRTDIPRVAIQVGASTRNRRYHLLGELMNELVVAGYETFLLGTPNDIPALRGKKLVPVIRNLTEIDLTFRQSCAVMNSADCFIGPDSAILHVAGALDVPAVGLYGAFPWKLRTVYHPSISPIQGTGACGPCFHHLMGTMQKHFPDHCPSKDKGICQVIGTITPKRIVERVGKIKRAVPAPIAEGLTGAQG